MPFPWTAQKRGLRDCDNMMYAGSVKKLVYTRSWHFVTLPLDLGH